MYRFLSTWLSLAALLLLAAVADAGGYTYKDGYYWSNGLAYQRYSTSCWNGSCWCQQYYYRPVSFAHAYQKTITTAAQKAEPYEQSKALLELAKLKLQYEHAAELAQQQREELRDGLAALGLGTPEAATPAAATAPLTASPSVPYTAGLASPALTTGTTVYGYQPSVATIAALSGEPVDVNARLLEAKQIVERLSTVVGEAHGQNLETIREAIVGRNEVAKALAIGHVLASTPQIESGASLSHTTATATGPGAGVLRQLQGLSTAEPTSLDAVIELRCASCHNAESSSGKHERLFPQGVNMRDWRQFNAAQWAAVSTAVWNGTMPKNGERLGWEEVRPFFAAHSPTGSP